MMGQYDAALSSFDLVLKDRPKDAEALGGRAIVHMACGRLAEADVDWRQQYSQLPMQRSSHVPALRCDSRTMHSLAGNWIARSKVNRTIPTGISTD